MKVTKFLDGHVEISMTVAEAEVLHDALVDSATSPTNQAKSLKGFVKTVSAMEDTLASALVTPAPAPRTFASKAERAAGEGFKCPKCLRNDLRVAPTPGRSFHDKDVKGNKLEVCDFR